MNNLIDTCVFLEKIVTPNNLINFTKKSIDRGEEISTSNIIMDELQPTPSLREKDTEVSIGILRTIDSILNKNSENICIINIYNNKEYKQNLDNIRKRFYSHVSDVNSLRQLIAKGEMKREEISIARKKDMGECSLIAIAMTNPKKYIIITEDQGKVYIKPQINLFQKYKDKYDLKIISYNELESELNVKGSIINEKTNKSM